MSDTPIRGLMVPAEPSALPTRATFHGLGTIQATVGGYVEAVNTEREGLTLYANDEGKLRGLPLNKRATVLWWLHSPAARGVDVLVGDVAVVGQPDPDGANVGLPEQFMDVVLGDQRFEIELQVGPARWERSDARYGYFAAGARALRLIAALGLPDARIRPA